MARSARSSGFPKWVSLELGVLMIVGSACGGGGGGVGNSPPPTGGTGPPVGAVTPLFEEDGHGHFFGQITVAGTIYYAEALITVDHQVKVYVGGPANALADWQSGAGTPEDFFHPVESMLFVGTIDTISRASASGSGAVIGQICDSSAARFCDKPATAAVSLRVNSASSQATLTGHLAVAIGGGAEESWAIELQHDDVYYTVAADLPETGLFEERLAPFAQAEEMLLELEPGGLVSFSSANSGCAGTGTLQPHHDGQYNVYDVQLRITGCNTRFAYLNSEFEGLATPVKSGGFWDYGDDYSLTLFLAAPDGPPPRPAVTLRAYLTGP
jgi:hypothetical protein